MTRPSKVITQNITALYFFALIYYFVLLFTSFFPSFFFFFLLIVWAALVPYFQTIVSPLAKWLCSKDRLCHQKLCSQVLKSWRQPRAAFKEDWKGWVQHEKISQLLCWKHSTVVLNLTKDKETRGAGKGSLIYGQSSEKEGRGPGCGLEVGITFCYNDIRVRWHCFTSARHA